MRVRQMKIIKSLRRPPVENGPVSSWLESDMSSKTTIHLNLSLSETLLAETIA